MTYWLLRVIDVKIYLNVYKPRSECSDSILIHITSLITFDNEKFQRKLISTNHYGLNGRLPLIGLKILSNKLSMLLISISLFSHHI